MPILHTTYMPSSISLNRGVVNEKCPWNIFQAQGLWLPTIPIPSTSSADDGTYSNIVLRELENSIQSRPSDWITTIRLALHYFMTRDLGIVESLLRRFVESDVIVLGEYGSPLLFLALVKGVDLHAADIIEDQTPLHAVRSAEAARALIEFGANLKFYCKTAPISTPPTVITVPQLYILARSADIVRVFLKYGADPLSKDRFGDTALHRTVSDEVAQCLMETCPELVHVKGLLDGTPLHRRVADWSAETIRMAIRLGADVDAPNSDGETALLRSHEFTGVLSDVEVVRTLIEAGAKVPLPKDDSFSSTPLHETSFAAFDGVLPGTWLSVICADINARNAAGETPVHCAARAETVLEFLRLGADPTLVDHQGVTILHNAWRFTGDCERVIEALTAHGADVDAADTRGSRPLHYACRGYEEGSLGLSQVRRWARSTCFHHGTPPLEPTIYTAFENALPTIKALLDRRADIHAQNMAGETAVRVVSRHPFGREVFRFLCERGADMVEIPRPWWNFD
ncbi:ankyrin repeat-containing domain protein [Armillaria novae-zelandiae]|uniref:Ankyrin repeat-containing domain protein n=1 Tax=Armillaria novae-zelandiae TaxID=153914 RepID=A0AA39PRQ9_9AGAR|nr:ankyrin repeat-containing domain protein [Armillaria novae-zelandiae]